MKVYRPTFFSLLARQGGKCVRNYLLSSCGYVVISIDSRGSSNRGKAFESHIYRRLGQLELADQLEVLRQMADEFPFLDLSRVAINGWSYGGYLALRGIIDYPDVFKVSLVRGSNKNKSANQSLPATHCSSKKRQFLLTTARDRRCPRHRLGTLRHGLHRTLHGPAQEQPGRLQLGLCCCQSLLLPRRVRFVALNVCDLYVVNLLRRDRLLVAHGKLDDNVHFQHTEKLLSALTQHQKPFRLQVSSQSLLKKGNQ